MAPNLSKTSPIVIVGAGVFGLSTAIHLAKRGYTNVTVLDKQPYDKSLYSYELGCDAASADVNKILRASYGSQVEYQTLALESIAEFTRWNEEIASGKSLPPGFTTSDKIFCNNGNLTMNDDASLTQFGVDTMKNMAAAGLASTQIVLTNPAHVQQAKAAGYGFAINPFHRPDKENFGLLDTNGGMVYADRACRFALHQAQTLGVKFVLDAQRGALRRLLYASGSKRVVGVQTVDGMSYYADLSIMACGGWTPSLVPELDGLCETTSGSVAIFQLPPGDVQLWSRFAPENFPTWTYKIRDGAAGGLYGFARSPNGLVKIGYRGQKYTNPQLQTDGSIRSVPITRYTTPASTRQLPQQAASVIRSFVAEYIPELKSCTMHSRLCWYTDTFDNHFIVDYLPGTDCGLMVATGGSGHGFKFLPNLGRFVVDKIEGVEDEAGLLRQWQWRSLKPRQVPYNQIMQGYNSDTSLSRQALTTEDSLVSRASNL